MQKVISRISLKEKGESTNDLIFRNININVDACSLNRFYLKC